MRAITLTLGILTSLIASAALPTEGAWRLLASVEIEEFEDGDIWEARKTFPDALVAAKSDFEITGYVVPITAEPYIQTFILVEDPDSCPFCGSSGYGPVLEVHLKRPMDALTEFTVLTVTGQLELIEDTQTYQSYRLVEAIPAPG